MKKIFLILAVLLGLSTAGAKSNAEAFDFIKELSEAVNGICPLKVSENLIMNQMSYNKSRNNLKVGIGIGSDNFTGINASPEELDMIGKNIISSWYTNDEQTLRQFVEDLGQVGATVTVDFKNLNTGKVQVVNISSQQIKSVVSSNPTAETVLDDQLQRFLNQERQQIGATVATGMVTSDVKDKGDFVEFVFMCDENVINIDILKSNLTSDTMENVLGGMLADPVVLLEMKCFADNGRGIKYTYVGSTSNKRAEGFLPADRLGKLCSLK